MHPYQNLVNRSITTQITLYPEDKGKPSMKSIEMLSQGRTGIGRGWSNPAGETFSYFTLWHVSHSRISRLTSAFIPGQ